MPDSAFSPDLEAKPAPPTMLARSQPDADYLLLSDVHLGSDLVQHLRPWAVEQWLREQPDIDKPLIELLDHYRTRPGERPLKLVLAGDFLDLVGVSIAGDGTPLRTPLTREEQAHGLGSAADHVVRKLEAIAVRHRAVFQALARFLESGHSIVVVRGNHDIELHWRAAQRALVKAIVIHAEGARRAELASRITICPWFYAVPGLLYVEHGHEFDATCSYGDPLLPTCPRDSRRIRAIPFSVLLRQVARPTRGLSSASYGYVGMGMYVKLLRDLGLRGSLDIAGRYSRASLQLLRESLAGAAADRRRVRAQAMLEHFCRASGISAERLSELRGLYTRPAVERASEVVRLLYLDRIVAGAAAGACAAAATASGGAAAPVLGLSAACLGVYAAIGTRTNQAPHQRLGEGARRIAQLFEARWVVMGHTHQPVFQPVTDRTTYVNLGAWGQDDPPDERTPHHVPSQSFLLVEHDGPAPQASFLQWVTGWGPRTMKDLTPLPSAAPEPPRLPAGAGSHVIGRLRALRPRRALVSDVAQPVAAAE